MQRQNISKARKKDTLHIFERSVSLAIIMFSHGNFHAITESDLNIVLAVNRDIIAQGVPCSFIENLNLFRRRPQRLHEILHH